MTATIHKLKPVRCPACGRPPKRSNQANKRYWALLHLISDELGPQGQYYAAKTWHKYFAKRLLGCNETVLPNGEIVTEIVSTADLDSSDFLDYTTAVEAWASEHGCYLED